MCDELHHQGILIRALTRREVLGALTAIGSAMTAACANDAAPTSTTTTPTTTTTSTNASCAVTPTETVGPYPSLTDLFRSDIREDRAGLPLTLTIKVVNTNAACAAVVNANVEIWHCDVAGNYSEYGTQTRQTYLRGIQTTNANGEVTFTTIYPGWYQGRATHIHAEVVMGGRSVKVTQMAFPESVNNAVHTSGVYASRGTNPTTNLRDGIFADSLASELVTPTGNVGSGYAASFQIAVAL